MKARAKVILTSMIKRVDNAVIIDGQGVHRERQAGRRQQGLRPEADGGVGFAENALNKAALADVREAILRIKNQIIARDRSSFPTRTRTWRPGPRRLK